MDFATAKASVDFLIKNAEAAGGVPGINFFGGEPMLMWETIIVPVVNWVRKEYRKPFDLSMTTNGTLLNEDRIRYLKGNNVRLLFSIDGSKETQDYNRPLQSGDSSFDVLQNVIPLIIKYRPETAFRMTAIPATCQHTYDNIMFAVDNGFRHFFVVPNVFEEWTPEDRCILEIEMRKFSDYYIESYRNAKTPINFSALDKSFSDIRKINGATKRGEHRKLSRCHACGKCGLGASRFASIHPNGNLYACQEMTSNEGDQSIFYIGNIFTGVENERRGILMSTYEESPVSGANCQQCKLNRICDGGCVANNYLLTGRLNKMPEVFCWWQQLLLDEAIYITQTLGAEENELFKQKWSRTL